MLEKGHTKHAGHVASHWIASPVNIKSAAIWHKENDAGHSNCQREQYCSIYLVMVSWQESRVGRVFAQKRKKIQGI